MKRDTQTDIQRTLQLYDRIGPVGRFDEKKVYVKVINLIIIHCSHFLFVASEKLATIEIEILFETVHSSEYNTNPTGNEYESNMSNEHSFY